MFYGYDLRTAKESYFLTTDYQIKSHSFSQQYSLEGVKEYFVRKGAKVEATRDNGVDSKIVYYRLSYRGFNIEIGEFRQGRTRIIYGKGDFK